MAGLAPWPCHFPPYDLGLIPSPLDPPFLGYKMGIVMPVLGFPGGSVVKNSPANAGDSGSIPGSGRSPGERNGNPLQYSCLGNPMDWGGWWDTVHGVTKALDTTEWLNNNNNDHLTGWGESLDHPPCVPLKASHRIHTPQMEALSNAFLCKSHQ